MTKIKKKEVIKLLVEAHNLLDDENAANNIGLDNLHGKGVEGRYCKWCQPWPPVLVGYDAQGLRHFDNCILMRIRKLIDVQYETI